MFLSVYRIFLVLEQPRVSRIDTRFNQSSNKIPSSSVPSRFYQKCLNKLIHLFNVHKCLPDGFCCKYIYSLLLSLPRDAPRGAGFWNSALCRPINRWATVWLKSLLKLNENKKNDILWLILHRAVRIRYSLKSWAYIDNDRCAICGRIENIEHCFLACPRVVRVCNHFPPLLSRLSNSTFVVSIPSVFYPLSDDQPPPLSSLLKATMLYWIWL